MLKRLMTSLFKGRRPVDSADKGDIEQWLERGHQHQQQGELARAEKYYRRVLEAQEDHAAGLYLLGTLLVQQGQLREAEKLLRSTLGRYPDFAEAHRSLGLVYRQQGLLAEAGAELLQALKYKYDSTNDLFELGKQLEKRAQTEKALSLYEEILRLEPGCYPAQLQIGNLFLGIKELQSSIEHYRLALAIAPGTAEVIYSLAVALGRDGQYQEAEVHFQQAIVLQPDNAIFNNGLGMLYRDQGNYQDALEYMNKAITHDPDSVDILGNIGILLGQLNQYDEAMQYIDRALAIMPEHAAIHLTRALLNLKYGKFAKGWQEFSYRFDAEWGKQRNLPYPEWQGEDLSGKRVLIYSEQGIGDEMMFASCFSDVLSQPGHVIIECNKKLLNLFKRSFPAADIHGCHTVCADGLRKTSLASLQWLEDIEAIDVQVAMGSLPGLFRNRWQDFPQHQGYLQADPLRIDHWRGRLDALGDGLKVGISWQGGYIATRSFLRSIPLAQWQPLLTLPDMHFVSLQYTDCSDELAEVQEQLGVTVHHWQEAIDDYDETAALVCALDRVVSIQTALVHLSGALGQRVDVLVPSTPEWRYLAEGERMPWYPTVKLHRQQQPGQWGEVLAAVAEELQT